MEDILELVERVRNHDDDAFTILLEEHRRMIYKIIYSFNLVRGDFRVDENDLFQEGSLALYDAVFTYRPERKTRFSSYAYIAIRCRIASALRRYYSSFGDDNYSIDHEVRRAATLYVSDSQTACLRENELKEIVFRFIMELESEDRLILKYRRQGLSYRQIAERLGISSKRVDNRIQNMKRRIKRKMAV